MAAHIGFLSLELQIPHAQSLKEKRRAVKSLKDRIRSRFNVSAAEIDCLDKWQLAVIGICMISNERAAVEGQLQQVLNLAETADDLILLQSHIQFL